MPVVYASLTGPLVTLAQHAIRSLGLAGVLALTATSGVIGVPGSEPTMLFAGFSVHSGIILIILFGVVGDMLGASIAYAIGYFGSQELLERHGTKFHVNPRSLERANRWFESRGAPVIFLSRLIPFVRAAFPYAAGVARMPYPRFAALATLGSIVWISALGLLGRAVGSNWEAWRKHLEYADYVAIALLVLAIVYFIVKRRRSRPAIGSDEAGADQAANVDVLSR